MSETGLIGENQAVRYLRNKGYKLLTRNFHSRFGEIDIVVQKKKTIVFVEVKSRNSNHFGTPREAVNSFKLQKMIMTAHIFLKKFNISGSAYQFDVVEVIGKEEPFEITHIENVTI